MPDQWCTHPTAHFGPTKIGSRPSHPRGDRKVTDELAMFIKESYGMLDEKEPVVQMPFLCRTCFDRERAKFNAQKHSRTNFKMEANEKMDIDYNAPKSRYTFDSTIKSLLKDDCLTDKTPAFLSSQSFTESEDNDDVESEYKQGQAKWLINKAFEALNIPEIIDV